MEPSDDLTTAARTAVEQCLAVNADESCTVVYDSGTEEVANALYEVAAEHTNSAVLIEYLGGETHGSEPPAPVAGALLESDVFLAPTSKSLSHTRARQQACEAGARGATLPGITPAVFTTGLAADYEHIATTCEDLLAQLEDATTIQIETDAGTDLTVEPGSRDWYSDTGIVHEPGDFSNLPAGEVFVSPATADGRVVIDGTMRPYGRLEHTIEVHIEDGLVTHISDEAVRETVDTAADAVGDNAYNVAELGVGANVGVTELVGSVLLDEKAAGTIHVAIGDDASIGGDNEAPIHLDGVIKEPRIVADGTPVELPTPRNGKDV